MELDTAEVIKSLLPSKSYETFILTSVYILHSKMCDKPDYQNNHQVVTAAHIILVKTD